MDSYHSWCRMTVFKLTIIGFATLALSSLFNILIQSHSKVSDPNQTSSTYVCQKLEWCAYD